MKYNKSTDCFFLPLLQLQLQLQRAHISRVKYFPLLFTVHRPCLFYTVNDDRSENLTVFLGNTIIYTFIPNKQR